MTNKIFDSPEISDNRDLHPDKSTELSPLEHDQPPPFTKISFPETPENGYVELKRLIKQKGLLDKQIAYTFYKIFLVLGMLLLGLIFLAVAGNYWLHVPIAAYLAFVFTQIGFVVHNAGHRQAFQAAWKNDIIGYTLGNLLLGMSYSWWVDKHVRHHSHPNDLDLDPDISIPFLAFSEEQALQKPRFQQALIKYQVYYFLPMLMLEGISLRAASFRFLLQNKAKYPLVEGLFMVTHLGLYFGLLIYFLGLWPTLIFIIVHQALFGLYTGLVFAPNHKGMLMPDQNNPLDFLHQQVLTSRNVKANPITDFWYGGLNYQIEHHLFPNMPQNKLREAQKVVKTFCQTHGIAYTETSVSQSFREILLSLREVSASLFKAGPPV